MFCRSLLKNAMLDVIITLAVLCIGFNSNLLAAQKTIKEQEVNSASKNTNLQCDHYKDNEDETVTDTKTGLMWTKFDSRSATGHWMSWDMANEWVKGLSTGGHRDWRMPTIAELKTLYDPQYSVLANGNDANFPMHFCLLFNSGGAWTYWSSENINKAEFWTLNFNNGYDYAVDGNDESINVGVRAVRNNKIRLGDKLGGA